MSQDSRGRSLRRVALPRAAFVALVLAAGIPGALGADGPGDPPPAKKATARSWPSFRGNPQMTGVATSTLPAKPVLLWTFETDEAVSSTAAIVAGVVYVATDDGRVLAIDLAKGKKLWEHEVEGGIEASPCVAGGTVYFGDGERTFHAVDARTGKTRWKHHAEAEIISSASVTPGGSVLFGSYDSRLYCLKAADGKELWRFQTAAPVHCSPCLFSTTTEKGERVLATAIAGCDGHLRLVGVKDGEEISSVEIGGNISASPAFDGRRMYFGTLDGRMVAADAGAKKILWDVKAQGNSSFYASAAVHSGAVVFAGRDRRAYCLKADTGKQLWVYEAKGGIDSSPVVVRDAKGHGARVIFGCKSGRIYALGLSDGKLKWSFEAGSEVTASPAIGEGRMVIGTAGGAVYCFGEKK